MMRAVSSDPAGLDPVGATPDDAGVVRGFVAGLEQEQSRRARRAAAIALGLPIAAVLVLLLWLWSPRAAAIGGGLAAVVVALRWWHVDVRACRRRALQRLGDLRPRLADELMAFDETQGARRGHERMLAWLSADLARELTAIARPPAAVLPHPRAGRVRYLLPVVVVLLLLWLVLPPLPVPGVNGSSAPSPTAAIAPGQDPGAGAGAPAAGGAPPPPVRSPLSPPPPSPEPEPPPADPVPPAAPAPLLDLPSAPVVVVPEFTADGPSRRAMAQRALLGVDGEGGAAPGTAASGAGPAVPPPPPPVAEQFARAAERAVRSRHVPDAERAVVRRFFELLQQEAK